MTDEFSHWRSILIGAVSCPRLLFLEQLRQGSQRRALLEWRVFPVLFTPCSDWGNPVLLWFSDEFKEWNHRILAIGADAYFKILIRRHRDGDPIWAWALEWNQNFRIIGFFGDSDGVRGVAETMPSLDLEVMHGVPGRTIRIRTERLLAPEDDHLFRVREPAPARSPI